LSRDRDEVLAEIYRRGNRLRWRARGLVASIGVVALVVTAGLLAAGQHGGTAHRTVLADGQSPSITITGAPGSAGTRSSADGGDDETSTTARHGSATKGHTEPGSSTTLAGGAAVDGTSTTLACHNSTDPACGPFRYDPPLPANRPTRITITPDRTPVAGEPVTFTITVDDPDGQGPGRCGRFDADVTHAEPTTTTAASQAASTCFTTAAASADPAATNGYGPWDPPSTVPGHVVTTYTVTYDAPGPHTVSYSTFDVGQCGDDSCPPAAKDLTFTVQPPASTTTTAKPAAKKG
jgi:hypothetical protein